MLLIWAASITLILETKRNHAKRNENENAQYALICRNSQFFLAPSPIDAINRNYGKFRSTLSDVSESDMTPLSRLNCTG